VFSKIRVCFSETNSSLRGRIIRRNELSDPGFPHAKVATGAKQPSQPSGSVAPIATLA
jgi:hypothetical protein